MNYSSRFFLYAPLAFFLGIAGWAMAHWWLAAAALDKKLNALNGHDAVPGIMMSYTGKTISGFPFNLDVVFTGFRIAGAGAHGPFAWTTERFALHALTYGRTQAIYEAAGKQTLSWRDGSGKVRQVDFLPGSIRASTITDSQGLSRFDLDIVDASGKKDDGANFAAARAQFHLRRDPDGRDLDLMTSTDNWTTRVGNSAAKIARLEIYATLTQASSLAPLLRGEQSWPQAAAAWRAQGGAMKADTQKSVIKAADGFSNPQDAAALLLSPLY